MSQINLNINPNQFAPKYLPYLRDYTNRREIYMGSAGSAKSYFITQKLIIKALTSKRKMLITRRYGTTLRNSVFSLFKDVFSSWHLTDYCHITDSNMKIVLPNGSEFIFMGLDDEQKLLSISGITDIFIEEVFEIGKDIYEQLELRLRAKAPNLQIFMAFNPISSKHWLYEYVNNLPSNSLYIHSTYLDNPFLPQPYIDTIEEMRTRNPNKFRIYGLGEWGIDTDGAVYTNWEKEDFEPTALAHLEHRVGMDLGWIDPTTVVCTLYDKENKRIYVYAEYYKRGAQLDDVAEGIRQLKLSKVKIKCDDAEPRTIAFFRKQGLSVVAAKKGKVEPGIAFIQNHEIIVHPSCTNVISELENYVYLKDKQTGAYTNKTDHAYSHTLDALRYAYADIYNNNKMGTLNKAALGL